MHGNITCAEEPQLSDQVARVRANLGSTPYHGRVFHYRIHMDPQHRRKFENLPELVVHHSKNPDGLLPPILAIASSASPKKREDDVWVGRGW